jgi:molecular chaperone IbpA
MRTGALQPMFRDRDLDTLSRNFIGLDNLFRDFFEDTGTVMNPGSYPPYNIESIDDNTYRITLAVAGFREDDLNITLQNGMLTIDGEQTQSEGDDKNYIYRGIATRSFRRQFKLGEHIEVQDATMDNGMLVVDLVRNVPEEEKPKQISIGSGPPASGKGKDAQVTDK